jgi:hypothetical protein
MTAKVDVRKTSAAIENSTSAAPRSPLRVDFRRTVRPPFYELGGVGCVSMKRIVVEGFSGTDVQLSDLAKFPRLMSGV